MGRPVWQARSQHSTESSQNPKGWCHSYPRFTTHLGLPVTTPVRPYNLALRWLHWRT